MTCGRKGRVEFERGGGTEVPYERVEEEKETPE